MNVLAMIEKFLPLVLTGVHAANTVPGATGADKKATVLAKVVAVADAVTQASGIPQVQVVGAMIDVAAQVVNELTTKTATAPAPATTPAAA